MKPTSKPAEVILSRSVPLITPMEAADCYGPLCRSSPTTLQSPTGLAGLEPTTYGLGNRRSIRLSYSPSQAIMGVEGRRGDRDQGSVALGPDALG